MDELLSNRPFCSNDQMISSKRKKSRWSVYIYLWNIFSATFVDWLFLWRFVFPTVDCRSNHEFPESRTSQTTFWRDSQYLILSIFPLTFEKHFQSKNTYWIVTWDLLWFIPKSNWAFFQKKYPWGNSSIIFTKNKIIYL